MCDVAPRHSWLRVTRRVYKRTRLVYTHHHRCRVPRTTCSRILPISFRIRTRRAQRPDPAGRATRCRRRCLLLGGRRSLRRRSRNRVENRRCHSCLVVAKHCSPTRRAPNGSRSLARRNLRPSPSRRRIGRLPARDRGRRVPSLRTSLPTSQACLQRSPNLRPTMLRDQQPLDPTLRMQARHPRQHRRTSNRDHRSRAT